MNSIKSLAGLRQLLSNSCLRQTINPKPRCHISLLCQNFAQNPRISCVGQITKSNYIQKRSFNEWFKKSLEVQSHANHGQVWVVERLVAVGSMTSFLAMFLHPCENTELFFAVILGSHVHFGMEAIFVDYLRPAVVGPVIPKLIPLFTLTISISLLLLLAWTAMYGNGIAGSLQQIWYLDPLIEPYDIESSKLHRPKEN